MKTVKELAKFIEKNASFDGTGDDECPHCHKVISYGYSWIDHAETLASEIATFLGLGGMISEIIYDNLKDIQFPNGVSRKVGFEELAERIFTAIYGNSHPHQDTKEGGKGERNR